MTALSTPSAPVIEVGESGALDVTWTKVSDADQYVLKAYKGVSYTNHDSAFDLTVGDVDKAVMRVAPGTSYKVTVTAQDTTATKTDSLESSKSGASTSTIPGEADETEAAAVVETVNPFTGADFAFAGATYGYVTYGRNTDGTIYQTLSGGDSVPGTPGPRAGTQQTKQRDAGAVTAALSLASDLRYVLTDPTDSTNGVAVVDPVALTVSSPTNTTEDYFVVGEGSYTQFTDRRVEEVDPDTTGVSYGAGQRF